jgi:Flp pilus assembly pilin Flp
MVRGLPPAAQDSFSSSSFAATPGHLGHDVSPGRAGNAAVRAGRLRRNSREDTPVGNTIRSFRTALARRERGQTNVEYAFILLLVAIATIVLLIALASNTNALLASVNANF